MKFNFKDFYRKLEKKPGLMLRISFWVFIVSFFFGLLAGNGYYRVQEKKMMIRREAQKIEETKKIEKIFISFPEKKFLQMIKK